MDLKAGVAQSMADVLEPVRDYFKQHPQNLKALQEIIAGK